MSLKTGHCSCSAQALSGQPGGRAACSRVPRRPPAPPCPPAPRGSFLSPHSAAADSNSREHGWEAGRRAALGPLGDPGSHFCPLLRFALSFPPHSPRSPRPPGAGLVFTASTQMATEAGGKVLTLPAPPMRHRGPAALAGPQGDLQPPPGPSVQRGPSSQLSAGGGRRGSSAGHCSLFPPLKPHTCSFSRRF